MCKIKCSFYVVFLKAMATKYCTVVQKKNGTALKPMQITTKNKLEGTKNTTNLLKPMRLCTKDTQKAADSTPGYSQPGGPAIRTTKVYMRPRNFASPARTARTTRTKRKRRRNEADLPVAGGRINRSNSLTPPIYIYIYIIQYTTSHIHHIQYHIVYIVYYI